MILDKINKFKFTYNKIKGKFIKTNKIIIVTIKIIYT